MPYLPGAAYAGAGGAARLDFSSTPQIITPVFLSVPRHAGPSDSFSLHRAGRAPPTA